MLEAFLARLTPGKAAAALFLILFALYWWQRFTLLKRIRQLGERAPVVPTYLPYGIDFVFKSMRARKSLRFVEHARRTLASAQQANGLTWTPRTVEITSLVPKRVIITIDPENIKAVLTGQFQDFGKGESFHREWEGLLGDSIFATDGEKWSSARQLLRPMFVRDRIVDTQMFEPNVQKLLRLFSGSSKKGKVVEVSDLFFRFTLDTSTEYLLGKGTDSLDNPKTRFAQAFEYVQIKQSEYFRLGFLGRFLPRRKFRQELEVMEDFIQPYIQTALTMSPEELDKRLAKQDTFLHALARYTRDPQVIRDQIVAVLLAGRDTTAATLSFCTFELARNPDVVARLRAEITARLGVGADAPPPTYEDLKEMRFLNAVLNETLRMYPAVPFNVRYCLRPTTLPRGGGPDGTSPIGVPADTRVSYSTMLLHRRPDLYGGSGYDPEKWIPDRWIGGWQPKPWHYLPFNGGPRICIGQQFALLEMGYTLVRILQTYERIVAMPITGEKTIRDPPLRLEITLSPGAELNCVFLREGENFTP